MKKNLLLLAITLTIFTIKAQETPNVPNKHKLDIAGQVSSPEEFEAPYSNFFPDDVGANLKDYSAFSIGFFCNYNFRNNVFIRLRVSMCNRNLNYYDENNDSLAGPIYVRNNSVRQNSKTFALSIGKNIVEQKFIRAYVGLEIATTLFDKSYNIYNHNEIMSGGISYVETVSTIVPGGYIVRLGPFVNCQLIFLKHFSIGPEISYFFQYINVGGMAEQHRVATNTGINSYFNNFDTTGHFVETNKKMGFSSVKVAFNIIYSF